MTTDNEPTRIVLEGIVGSTAHHLNRPGSDTDRLGIYASPAYQFLGLNPPTGGRGDTWVSSPADPDRVLHEALKFCRLAVRCNPSVMELLWLPTHLYLVIDGVGADLIRRRGMFLSAPFVKDAYLGYATSQFGRLQARGDGTFDSDLRTLTEKQARHLLRLVNSGVQLWKTGELTVAVDDPATYFTFGERVADGDIGCAHDALAAAEVAFTTPTVLPSEPDSVSVDRWLHSVRGEFRV